MFTLSFFPVSPTTWPHNVGRTWHYSMSLGHPMWPYTWGDNCVTPLTTVTADMLEIYLLQLCNVVNLRVLANCCVWNYTSVEKTRSANNIGIRMLRFPHFSSVCVNTKYASNMAACYENNITSPHVYNSECGGLGTGL